jgi:hypothetical protein
MLEIHPNRIWMAVKSVLELLTICENSALERNYKM